MKVLHVTESRSWSGGTVQLWNLCKTLQKAGHEVSLFCPPNSELLHHINGTPIDLTTCPLRQDYDISAAQKIAGVIRRFNPDIVHAHHPRAHALTLLASFFISIPSFVVSRRVSFKLKKWNIFSQWKYRTSRIRKYVAVSNDIRDVLIHGGVRSHKVEVIHSGVDVDKFSPREPAVNVRKELGLPTDIPIVANLTHFSWWKGQTYFLEAAKILIDQGVRAYFLLMGKETDGEVAKEKVRSLGIRGHVTLAGFRRDVPEILSLTHMSVLSSLAGEGFSGVLREAMSMGIPVVATDVGGNKELVENEKTGLLVASGNARSLAEAMKKFLTEKELSKECALRAQEKVRSLYSIQHMVEKTIDLYKGLLS